MSLYNQGLSYSTINTASSALSSILNIEGPTPFGSHPLVMRFSKGVYETRKPQPKYTTIWDVATVLKHLKTLWPLQHHSLKFLTSKLLILILPTTGQRGQSIHLFSLDGMTMSAQSCAFELLEHVKTSRPNKREHSIDINSYQPDDTLCPLLALKEYTKRTENLRSAERKLLSVAYSHIKGCLGTLYQGGPRLDLKLQGLIQPSLRLTALEQLSHLKLKIEMYHWMLF